MAGVCSLFSLIIFRFLCKAHGSIFISWIWCYVNVCYCYCYLFILETLKKSLLRRFVSPSQSQGVPVRITQYLASPCKALELTTHEVEIFQGRFATNHKLYTLGNFLKIYVFTLELSNSVQ